MRSGSFRVADCTPWQECLETVLLKCHIGFRGEAHSSSCHQAEGQEGPRCCKRDDDVDLRRLRQTMRLIASCTDDEGIRRPRRLSPSCVCVCVCIRPKSETESAVWNLLLLHPFNGFFSGTTWVSRYQKGFKWGKRWWGFGMAVSSAGPYANNLHLAPDG